MGWQISFNDWKLPVLHNDNETELHWHLTILFHFLFLLFHYLLFILSSNLDRTAAHKDVCFLQVDEGLICSEPRNGMVVTYSECCCHYGRGWGPECNTCPPRNSGEPTDFTLCWIHVLQRLKIIFFVFRNVQSSVWDASWDWVWWGAGFPGSFC